MFRKIREVTFKISPYCNLKCEYCFQQSQVKEDVRIFDLFDEMTEFLKKLPLDDRLEFKVTGGESSLFCNNIKHAYRKLQKLERYKDTKIRFTTITNGTNLEGILELMDIGVFDPWGCKISWDGLYSASKSRKPKNTKFTDVFFNNKIGVLGESKYSDQMLVRIAVTPNTVENLAASFEYALDCGCRKIEYYFLTDCDDYKNSTFMEEFEYQLMYITGLYNEYKFRFPNFETISFTNTLTGKDKLRSIGCRHLGRSLYIDMDGNVSPCGFFSDDCIFEECRLYIGDIFSGFYKDKVKYFIDEYTALPMCDYKNCNNLHCFECPATAKHRKGHMQEKLCQTCGIRSIEKKVFDKFVNPGVIDINLVNKSFHYSEGWNIDPTFTEFLPYK